MIFAALHRMFHDGYFDYYGFKRWILDASGFAHSTLHIYLGLLIQLAFCVLLGKRISHPVPLYFVYVGELINEIHDALYGAHDIDKAYAMGFVGDWIHSIVVPTTFFLLARYTKILVRDV